MRTGGETTVAATEASGSSESASASRSSPILPGLFAGEGDDTDDRQRALDALEQRTAAQRVRAALGVGILLWPGFLGVDAVFASVYGGGMIVPLVVRSLAFVVMIAVRHRLGQTPPPAPRQLVALDGLVFGFTSA